MTEDQNGQSGIRASLWQSHPLLYSITIPSVWSLSHRRNYPTSFKMPQNFPEKSYD